MPLFERGYRAAARTELERTIRAVEDRDKAAQTRQDFNNCVLETRGSVNFAEYLGVISAGQAASYRIRLEQAQREFERLDRTERRLIVDDFENPLERAARFRSMDDARTAIGQSRAAEGQGTSAVAEQEGYVERDE